jgi:hypothetical protein
LHVTAVSAVIHGLAGLDVPGVTAVSDLTAVSDVTAVSAVISGLAVSDVTAISCSYCIIVHFHHAFSILHHYMQPCPWSLPAKTQSR